MRHFILYFALTTLLLQLSVFSVRAGSIYEEGPVSEAGTIDGKVTFSGEIPAPKVFKLRNYPYAEFCGKISDGLGNRVHQAVRVGEGGGFAMPWSTLRKFKAGNLLIIAERK